MPDDRGELVGLLSQLALDGPRDGFLVLADWLQSRGDPWGELIAIECAEHRSAEVTSTALRLLATHGRALCPVYGTPGRLVEWERGFVVAVTFTDEAAVDIDGEVRPLLAAPALALAERLSFENAHLDDKHAAALLRLAAPLRRFGELNLEGNWFSPDAVHELRIALPIATLGFQRVLRRSDDGGSYRALVKSWGRPHDD